MVNHHFIYLIKEKRILDNNVYRHEMKDSS